MCKSRSEGGQRCAAHTRPAYKAATFGTPEWDRAAAEYASTPSGAKELEAERELADLRGHIGHWAALGTALREGRNLRITNMVMGQNKGQPVEAVDSTPLMARLYPHAASAPSVPGETGMWPSERRATEPSATGSTVLIADDIDATPPYPFTATQPSGTTVAPAASVNRHEQVAAHEDDHALTQIRGAAEDAAYNRWVAEHGEPPIRNGWDGEGWYVDDNGDRFGTCNACGEEARESDECCDDGEIVPRDQ